MRRWMLISMLAIATLGIAAYGLHRVTTPAPPMNGDTLDVTEALGGTDTKGYARAIAPRPFDFPRDHGPHPEFRNEWWYFTGNLRGRAGERFGFELALFRIALAPQAQTHVSKWATNQVYMGHFTVTDVTRQRFHFYERFARGALGLAGATAAPFGVWLEDWSVRQDSAHADRWNVQASADGTAIALALTAAKPIVLQGERGLSRKSAEPGNASYYYSITRLATEGRVTLEGVEYIVEGDAWFDREWSTSTLSADQAGWDWFGIQFDDGTDLMVYRLRRRDGGMDPSSQGLLVDTRGRGTRLQHDDFALEVREWWTNPRGERYPGRVRLTVTPAALELDIVPLVKDQELNVSVRYWEGAVAATGQRAGRPIAGHGYMELTGYAGVAARR